MRQTLLPHQCLPRTWLVTDARTAAVLGHTLRALSRGSGPHSSGPRRSGVIFRHYHLPPVARRAAFRQVLRLCRARGHVAVLAGSAREALAWGADGAYGPPALLAPGPAALRLCTAHSLRELAAAARARADAVLLSPVFPSRSHPDGRSLGPVRFLLLARRSPVPVIALGGMTATSARHLPTYGWAAIDGLARKTRGILKDS